MILPPASYYSQLTDPYTFFHILSLMHIPKIAKYGGICIFHFFRNSLSDAYTLPAFSPLTQFNPPKRTIPFNFLSLLYVSNHNPLRPLSNANSFLHRTHAKLALCLLKFCTTLDQCIVSSYTKFHSRSCSASHSFRSLKSIEL